MAKRGWMLGVLLLSASCPGALMLLGCPASEQPYAGGSAQLELAPLEARHVTLWIPSSVVAQATGPLFLGVYAIRDPSTVDPTVALVADSADLGADWTVGRGSVPLAVLRAACPAGDDCRIGLTVENTASTAADIRLSATCWGQFDAAHASIQVVLD